MSLQTWAAIATVCGAIIAMITLALMVGKPLRKLLRQNDEFREDWYGIPARPGRDPVPGVPERLRRIEKELHPNGGGTMRDALNRVEQRLNDHIAAHASNFTQTPTN